jgi:hypothetical protein
LDAKFNFSQFEKKITLFRVCMQKLCLLYGRASESGFLDVKNKEEHVDMAREKRPYAPT